MSYSKLVAHFRDREEFPIKIDEITDWLVRHGYQDEISFYAADMDTKILRGIMTRHVSRPGVYADPKFIVEIKYPKSANKCWERMICCKELIHLFDTPTEKTHTAQQIANLTLNLTSPISPSLDFGPDFIVEHMAVTKALLLLAPIEIVEEIRQQYESGSKKPYDVALFFRIPETFVPMLFSPFYRVAADMFLGGHGLNPKVVSVTKTDN